jgi:threonine aldolase
MISFESDYMEGGHPEILRRLAETNLEQTIGYGEDKYCLEAQELIKSLCGAPKAAVHFLVGGTITNKTVICSALRPHQGVLSPTSGHINVHETGAIEATGHKVLALPSDDSKLSAAQVSAYCEYHLENMAREHMVQPGMLYVSMPTETGLVYTKAELQELYKVCKKYSLYFFIDGARLGYGITAPGSDLSYADLPKLCDVFYIGGTKVGALFGEAVVIVNEALKKDFRYIMKQTGSMLAKGRLLGLQFKTLFEPMEGTEEVLYTKIARHGVTMANLLKEGLVKAGMQPWTDSVTNQQFFVLPNKMMEKLSLKFGFEIWDTYDDNSSVVRFCTSWATQEPHVLNLIKAVEGLRN